MLESLFGNQNVTRILLFLFVNERCYATQLQILLDIPLSPIQNGLSRLEKGGVISSTFEGKRRIFQLSPIYPLRTELEALLQKAYTLLPTQEKKKYCFVHKPRTSLDEERERECVRKTALIALWKRLVTVKELTFSAKVHEEKTHHHKQGKAKVTPSLQSPSILLFEEQGNWLENEKEQTSFKNAFRWTLDLSASLLTLEHLRYGTDHPVFLFHLTPTGPKSLESVDAHLYAQDTYLGSLIWTKEQIQLEWRIIGPQKNEKISYFYH